MSQMRFFIRLLLGVIGGMVVAVGQASMVLAHEGETHLGEGLVLTPLIIAILGGTLAGLLLAGFLLWAWGRRALRRKEEQERRLQSASAGTMTSESDNIRQEG